MIIKPVLKGIATYLPGVQRKFASEGNGESLSARYCYSVWLRHLVIAHRNHLPTHLDAVGELGPGRTLGVGLAALLSGANKYYALDIIRFTDTPRNTMILDELVDLFRNRAPIPDEREFPNVKPYLDSYEFPKDILSKERIEEACAPSRVQHIKDMIPGVAHKQGNEIEIDYFVPWYDKDVVKENSIDMILSQAVLEHVDDLSFTYEALRRWLKPGGFISQQIDFKSHGILKEWNGHWACSDLVWRFVRGKTPFFLNRQPHSMHIHLLEKTGFQITNDISVKDVSGITRERLASRFADFTDDDLTTSGAFIQAVKIE